MIDLTEPPRIKAKPWHRYEVMMASCLVMACSMPAATASCPVERWQKPRIFFSLYRRSAAISMRLQVRSIRERLQVFAKLDGPYRDHIIVHPLQLCLGGG